MFTRNTTDSWAIRWCRRNTCDGRLETISNKNYVSGDVNISLNRLLDSLQVSPEMERPR